MDLEIPTGQPLVYELNDDLTVAKNTTYKPSLPFLKKGSFLLAFLPFIIEGVLKGAYYETSQK